jgi:hypothetical protein
MATTEVIKEIAGQTEAVRKKYPKFMLHISREMKLLLDAAPTAAIFATLFALIEKYVGLQPAAYLAWIGLFLLDFFSALNATTHTGEKIEAAKLPKFLTKFTYYSVMLIIFQTFSTTVEWPKILLVDTNWCQLAWWMVFCIVSMAQFRSILLHWKNMGYREAGMILSIIDDYLTASSWKKIWQRVKKKSE